MNNDSVAERVASVFSIPVHIGKETGADEESIYDADGGFVCECNSKSRARVISDALNAFSTLAADNAAKDAEIARLKGERDAWQREWKAALVRIGGPTNEAAAREAAQYILQTTQRWRDGRSPAPLIIDPVLDAESFVVIIKNAISARTDELQSQLAAVKAERDGLQRRFESIAKLNSNRGVYLSEYFDSVTEAGIDAEFQDGDEVTGAPDKLLAWVKESNALRTELTAMREATEGAKKRVAISRDLLAGNLNKGASRDDVADLYSRLSNIEKQLSTALSPAAKE